MGLCPLKDLLGGEEVEDRVGLADDPEEGSAGPGTHVEVDAVNLDLGLGLVLTMTLAGDVGECGEGGDDATDGRNSVLFHTQDYNVSERICQVIIYGLPSQDSPPRTPFQFCRLSKTRVLHRMAKIDTATVMGILQGANLPPVIVQELEKKFKDAAAEEKIETDPAEQPAYAPLLLMTGDALTDDSPFFILEFDENKHNFREAIAAFKKAIWEHNDRLDGKKKSTRIISTLGSAFQFLTGKDLKAAGLKIRFKSPVIMVREPNEVKAG